MLREGDNQWLFRDDDGTVELRSLAPGFAWVKITQRLGEGAVPFFNARLPPLMEQPETILFFDTAEMQSFANAARTGITDIIRARFGQLTAINVLVRSALIGMAVTATGLALGGKIHSFREPSDFSAALSEEAQRRKVDAGMLPY